jgi:hypothetical protein
VATHSRRCGSLARVAKVLELEIDRFEESILNLDGQLVDADKPLKNAGSRQVGSKVAKFSYSQELVF